MFELANAHNDALTRKQVANALQVSVTTVTRLIGEGQLPAFRIGRQWRVRRIDLENFMHPVPVAS